MSMPRTFVSLGFALATLAGANRMVLCPCGWADCKAPAGLEARIQTQPDAAAYAELGGWFDQNHQAQCAIGAYRSAVKLAPDSSRLNELLGRSLYAAGPPERPLRRSKRACSLIQELKAHLLLGAALAQLGRNQEAASEWSARSEDRSRLEGRARRPGQKPDRRGDYASVIRNLRSVARDENLTLDLAIAYRKYGHAGRSRADAEAGSGRRSRLRRFDRGSGRSLLTNRTMRPRPSWRKRSPARSPTIWKRSGSISGLW